MNSATPFPWPDGRRAAVSLTFDDARSSQILTGVPILDRHGLRATFYVSPKGVARHVAAWKDAAAHGHEIGNHTDTHPCSANFPWAPRDNVNEDYTLERMADELDRADRFIETTLGVIAHTFAYPCGHTFVGRGRNLRSYIPLVAERYVAGRHAFNETDNDPSVCDLALLAGIDGDGASLESLVARVERARERGAWLVLFGHEVSDASRQAMHPKTLDALAAYLREQEDTVWTETVRNVAEHVRAHRTNLYRLC